MSKERPETLVTGGYDQSAMDAAIARARAEVDQFIELLQAGDADSFSVKAPITDSNGTEHFWISEVRFEDGFFIGNIANEAGIVGNVKLGQQWRIAKGEISDWMYVRGEKIHGGYTIDPLLPTYPKDEAESLRARLVR